MPKENKTNLDAVLNGTQTQTETDPAKDNAGGEDAATTETPPDTNAQIASLLEANKKLTDSLAKIEADLNAKKQAALSDEELAAREANDFKKLWEIEKTKNEQITADVQERDRKIQEAEQRVIKSKMEEAFLKELGAEVVNKKLLAHVNWDKFVLDKADPSKIAFNKDGVKQAVSEWKQEFGEIGIKKAAANSTDMAASGGKNTVNPNDDIKTRIQKLGLV